MGARRVPLVAVGVAHAFVFALILYYVGPEVGLYPPSYLVAFSYFFLLGWVGTVVAFLNARDGGPPWASLVLPPLGFLLCARLWDLLTGHVPDSTPEEKLLVVFVGLCLGAGVVLFNRRSRAVFIDAID